MLRNFVASSLFLALVTVTSSAPAMQTQRAKPEPQWSTYLVKVCYLALQDPSPEETATLKRLQDELAAAKDASESRAAKRALERATAEVNARRGAIIYGWTLRADAAGKPVESTRTIKTFFLPNDDVNRPTLIKLKTDSLVTIDRNGSRELFVFDGRTHVTAVRCAPVAHKEEFGSTAALKVPPDQPLDDQLRNAITTTLTLQRTKKTEKGNTLYRYMLKIAVSDLPSPYANRAQINIWVNGRIRTSDGLHIGPFFEHIALERSPSGKYGQTRSYEFIALSGVLLDEKSATVDLLTAQ